MPVKKRIKTAHTGVFYIWGTSVGSGKPEQIYYVRYRKNGKLIEEKAGRRFQDKMTAEKASKIRTDLINGKRLSRKKLRAQGKKKKETDAKTRIQLLENELAQRKKVEEKWLLFTKSATEAFTLLDDQLNVIETNDASLLLFPGMEKHEIEGNNFTEVMKALDIFDAYKKFYPEFIEVLRTGKTFTADDFIPPSATYGHDRHIFIKTFKVGDGLGIISSDITESQRAEKSLKQSETELKQKTNDLEEINTALRVLLKKREEDKKDLEEKILINIKDLIDPYLDKMKNSQLNNRQKAYMDIISSNLNDIISPFVQTISTKQLRLTPTEVQIANFVKQGKTTKEIATLLHLSIHTIEAYRKNIRKKLGISGKKVNLRTYLLSNE